jgi:hypothetical protein
MGSGEIKTGGGQAAAEKMADRNRLNHENFKNPQRLARRRF